MNIQEKILAHVARAIEESQQEGSQGQNTGLEVIHNRRWANTGTIVAMRDFDTKFALSYDFQSEYASLTLWGEAIEKLLDNIGESSGIQNRVAPRTGVKYRTTTVDGVEYRVDDRDLAIQWHYLKYTEGEGIRRMIALINRLALASSHLTTASRRKGLESLPHSAGRVGDGAMIGDYCQRCSGYTAELDDSGYCERCDYRQTLEEIADLDPVDNALDPQRAARIAREALNNWKDEC